MPGYAAFGLRLNCDFELPELGPPTDAPGSDWQVAARQGSPPPTAAHPIGEDGVYGPVRVRSFATRDGFRMVFDDTGTFDVCPSDRVIAWYAGPASSDAAVRADLLGRVIALAAHATGQFVLHASAVSIGGRAVGFVGPKHAGKSTTALALVRRGARLITDDTLVVSRVDGDGAWVVPGVQRVRLWDDSARVLDAARTTSEGAKPTITPLPPAALEPNEVRLGALYVVRGAPEDGSGAFVTRNRMSPVQAAIAAVQFAKLGPLLGGSEAPVVLDRAGRLSGVTPFFTATVSRDLGRLDDVAARFLEWHGVASVPGVGAAS